MSPSIKKPRAIPHGEAMFALHARAHGLPAPRVEYPFHPERLWRFDFAWPDLMIAVEIEGGTRNGGRHTRHEGFEGDCAKYNAAAELGWRVFRFTTSMVNRGIAADTMRRVVGVAA